MNESLQGLLTTMNFFKTKTPAEIMRENKRSIDRAIRDIDREKAQLDKQEKKLVMDIKKAAKEGKMNVCKIMAKDLVRVRKQIQKFYQMKAQMQGVSLHLTTLKSTQAMSTAMASMTKAMQRMNGVMNLPGLQKIMQEFSMQSEMMDMKQEMMNDAMDDVLEDENDEEESEQIVNQVLEEIGISLNQNLPSAESGTNNGESLMEDNDLQARLDSLRSK